MASKTLTKLDDIQHLVQDEFNAVNAILSERLNSHIPLIDKLCQHIIQGGGKRIRPLLLLLSAKACGYQGSHHISQAAAIECFHTATLLHDDVIDESSLRRGQETAHAIWGSKTSILVGDYLFTQAFQLMLSCKQHAIPSLLADTSHAITCGEVQQLSNRYRPDISEQDYFEVIRYKTGLLFATSCKIGAILAQLSETEQKNMADFGLFLGNAFQLVDDALDYCASSSQIGKNIGDDLADGKPTLPFIYAMHHGNPKQAALLGTSLKTGNIDDFSTVLDIITATKAIDYTYEIARKESVKAALCLQSIPPSRYKDALLQILEFTIQRDS